LHWTINVYERLINTCVLKTLERELFSLYSFNFEGRSPVPESIRTIDCLNQAPAGYNSIMYTVNTLETNLNAK